MKKIKIKVEREIELQVSSNHFYSLGEILALIRKDVISGYDNISSTSGYSWKMNDTCGLEVVKSSK